MHIASIVSFLAATSSKTPAKTNSATSFIFLIVVFGLLFVMYRMFMRPKQRAAQQQRDTLLTLEPGDEVLTGAGIFGTIQHVQGDRVTLWTGTGSTITVLKRTVVRKIEENDPEYDAGAEQEEGEHDSWDDEDTAALEAHNADAVVDGNPEGTADGVAAGEADADGAGPRLGATTNGAGALSAENTDTTAATESPAKDKTKSSTAPSPEAANDGHLADRIDELTAPERPSEDKDR